MYVCTYMLLNTHKCIFLKLPLNSSELVKSMEILVVSIYREV